MLGCGTAGGNRRCIIVLQHRLKDFRAKLPRVAILRRAGVDTVAWVRVAGNPAMEYGADTMGISDSMLDRQRAAASTVACAPGRGQQKDLALWFADARGKLPTPPSRRTSSRSQRWRGPMMPRTLTGL